MYFVKSSDMFLILSLANHMRVFVFPRRPDELCPARGSDLISLSLICGSSQAAYLCQNNPQVNAIY